MLRRAQSDTAEMELEGLDVSPPKLEAVPAPRVERRKTEQRRGMDVLREEALRNVISRVEDRNFGGLRNQVHWRRGMKPSRIVLVLVALLAGGGAAYLATQHDVAVPQAVTQTAEPAREASTQILVAKQTIGIGQRLSPASVEWQDWPVGSVRPEYITVAQTPGAITAMAGSVARVQLFAGEPIRPEKVAPAGGGLLSAILEKGMRGVSVSVGAESASGGFIIPNDHVDVLLTRTSGTAQESQIILSNVQVLAINARLGQTATATTPAGAPDPASDVFAGQAIATLALDATQAALITNATSMGKLTLLLRPTGDSAESGSDQERAANMAIRLSSPFWTAKAGNTSQMPH